MKSFLKIIFALVALVCAVETHAQVTPLRSGTALSNIVTIGHTTSSNLVNASVIPLTIGQGLTLIPYHAGAQSTNTGVVGFLFALSTDGTNYTTTTPVAVTTTGTGASAVRDFAYIPPTTLGGATHAKILTLTNSVTQKGTCTITNVYWYIPY